MGAEPIRLIWPNSGLPDEPPGVLRTTRKGASPVRLVHGDNHAVLRALRDRGENDFALVYMDPPFFTGRQHHRVERTRSPDGGIVRSLSPAFDDRWSSLSEYLAALRLRVAVARDLLRVDGTFVLHVDAKTSHYCKVLCDEVFGPECFASEIIWRYRRWPSKTKNFQRVHDVLLRYARTAQVSPQFNQLYEPLAASTLATWGKRKQRAVVDAEGKRLRSSTTDVDTLGVPMGDVWDIGIVAPVSKERTGYPTQKPEALLERVILACTSKGDKVLDPYMGSATTLAVATRLGRLPTGIDVGSAALEVAQRRLAVQGIKPQVERLSRPRPTRLRSTRPRPDALLETG